MGFREVCEWLAAFVVLGLGDMVFVYGLHVDMLCVRQGVMASCRAYMAVI